MNEELNKATKYLKLAKYNAELFSKDPHTKVGCIILTENFTQILSTGINGFPRKLKDDVPERLDKINKLNYMSHSEANAVANAAKSGISIDNSVIVITKFPCSTCSKLLIQSGIKKIYTVKPDYNSITWGNDAKISEEMLNEVNIEIIFLEEI